MVKNLEGPHKNNNSLDVQYFLLALAATRPGFLARSSLAISNWRPEKLYQSAKTINAVPVDNVKFRQVKNEYYKRSRTNRLSFWASATYQR